MNKKEFKSLGTQPIRINTGLLDIVRDVKNKLGFPIARFIEDAIVEKIDKLPKKLKEKIGLYEYEENDSKRKAKNPA